MGNFNIYFPIEIEEEGSVYENVPGDNGGCTKYGLTLDDLKKYYHDQSKTCADVASLDRPTAGLILKKLYWDLYNADNIPNQSLSMFIPDGALNQGVPTVTKMVQQILGLTVDGVPGPDTSAAIIAADPAKLFAALYQKRKQRYDEIVANNPFQQKFYKGWINRLNNIQFKP